eukprot:s306_g24.t1
MAAVRTIGSPAFASHPLPARSFRHGSPSARFGTSPFPWRTCHAWIGLPATSPLPPARALVARAPWPLVVPQQHRLGFLPDVPYDAEPHPRTRRVPLTSVVLLAAVPHLHCVMCYDLEAGLLKLWCSPPGPRLHWPKSATATPRGTGSNGRNRFVQNRNSGRTLRHTCP